MSCLPERPAAGLLVGMFPRYWLLLSALWCAAAGAWAEEPRWLEPAARMLSGRYHELAEREERLRGELTKLPPAPVSQQSERIGWHSQFARSANATKWLQVDLGGVEAFEAIVLVPVDVAYGTRVGPGFGFPLRFRVEASDDEAFSEPRLLASFDDADFPNPGNAPVFLSTPGANGRFVRITATRLWPRDELALVALGEVLVLRGGLNIAAAAPVRVSDAYNNAPTWEPANATDGQSVLGAPVEIAAAPGNGWHAKTMRAQDVEKWVQVDLGAEMVLDEVRLYPARPKDFPARRGFGFPLRFRVEAANEAGFVQPVMLFDQTQADFVNPAENPVVIPVKKVRARFIRVTATKLWERTNDFIFAFAELEAYSSGKNVALGAAVTALDGIEAPSWDGAFWSMASTARGASSRWRTGCAVFRVAGRSSKSWCKSGPNASGRWCCSPRRRGDGWEEFCSCWRLRWAGGCSVGRGPAAARWKRCANASPVTCMTRSAAISRASPCLARWPSGRRVMPTPIWRKSIGWREKRPVRCAILSGSSGREQPGRRILWRSCARPPP